VQVLYASTAGASDKEGEVVPVVQVGCGGCRDRKRVEDLTVGVPHASGGLSCADVSWAEQIESVLVGPPGYTYR
jgi:hypothetical protein